MNKQELDILKILAQEPFINQRILAETSGYSVGGVNKVLHTLVEQEYIDEGMRLTNEAKKLLENAAPGNAIILAAGFGMRMIPINTQTPKALIEVSGEIIIERIIKQLHEVGITEVYIVVGFMKEEFEYLIDKYGVTLVVNEEYSYKNNLHSLYLVRNQIKNTYIIPGDIWCAKNPFNYQELYSWYMVTDMVDDDSTVRVNRKMELVSIEETQAGNGMIGISYLVGEEGEIVRERLEEFDKNLIYKGAFWEATLYENDRMIVSARVVSAKEYVEINTYEQLRELDEDSNALKVDAVNMIARILKAETREITDISVLKKGMTNRSFLFQCKGKKYIMRIPGEGTSQLINRQEEAAVYDALKGRNICDDVVYINPKKGYKITEFLEGSRVCDAFNDGDLKACMKKLREFHHQRLSVNHEFDIFKQILFYEGLWGGNKSIFRDYEDTKKNVFSLKQYIDSQDKERCLTHIDAVPDNFLFTSDGEIRLIDWEYAGMQDPHVDIAMFCIYSLYNREQIDKLIDIYFEGNCPEAVRTKIYCYVAACGLLWSNWCEYKRNLGVEFGEYSLRQYRYAKEYCRIVNKELEERDSNGV